MKELFNVKYHDGAKKQVVSARELYSFLSSNDTRHLTEWMKRSIEKNEYATEWVDYQRIPHHGDNGRLGVDYYITLDFAKELCMMSQCAKGKEARLYFIECEEKLKAATSPPKSFAEALRLAADQQEKIEEQQRALAQQAPKVEYVEKVLLTEDTFTTTQIAKELGMSATKLHKRLQELKVMFRQSGEWLLYSKYQDKGFTKTRTTIFADNTGKEHSNVITVWTQKGRAYLHKLFNEELSYNPNM